MATKRRTQVITKLWEKSKTCYYCNKEVLRKERSLEHIVPLSRGGTNKQSNLAITHHECNAKKGNKLIEEMEQA